MPPLPAYPPSKREVASLSARCRYGLPSPVSPHARLAAIAHSCFVDYPTTVNSTSYNCTSTTHTLTSVPEYLQPSNVDVLPSLSYYDKRSLYEHQEYYRHS